MQRWLPLLVLAAAIVAAPAHAGPIASVFGPRVAELRNVKAPYLKADLDGDGAVDSVYLVSVSAGSKTTRFAAGATVISNFWSSRPLGNHAAPCAIAIILAKDNRGYLITGYQGEGTTDFFDSPSWQAADKPLSLAKRKGRAVLAVGTEAGIDTTVYWNGHTFALFEPIEEP